ncbi:MAG TPA: AMP-binding protein [Candidatus Methylomirabilis sp.]|nr:AMP-binding protein [Candidatus Methylomirabilis sp.]
MTGSSGAAGRILDLQSYDEVVRFFSWSRVWELFDGNEARMNLTHECIDRHGHRGAAISVKFADGHSEHYDFAALSDLTSRFANWLRRRGIARGDRVAVVVDPSRAFYVGMFGAMKYGAIAVPLYTLFGPEGLALRINDCAPRLILTQGDPHALRAQFPHAQVVGVDETFWGEVAAERPEFAWSTRASDLALFQYTSGTTRELPDAVKHTHRAVVTLMVAALYGLGLRPGDRYFCPSSPAWGHGLAHGTISPLALGIHTASYAGKFEPIRIFEALQDLAITNVAAAPTVFRMLRNSGLRDRYRIKLQKLSYTGEPMDSDTMAWIQDAFKVTPCSMYGTTEVGVLIVNYPGLDGYQVKRGSLGKPAPGLEVAIVDESGRELPPAASGEIAVRRKGAWFHVKDRGYRDEEGYFYIEGRSDDVIISAGWTMSAVEIENTLLKHPAVLEAAVVGVPDALRGQVARAYIVARDQRPGLVEDVQAFMKDTLGKHEYPRQVELVEELPRTPGGKVNRKALRDRAKQIGEAR